MCYENDSNPLVQKFLNDKVVVIADRSLCPRRQPALPLPGTAGRDLAVLLQGAYVPILFDPNTGAPGDQLQVYVASIDAFGDLIEQLVQEKGTAMNGVQMTGKQKIDPVTNLPVFLTTQGDETTDDTGVQAIVEASVADGGVLLWLSSGHLTTSNASAIPAITDIPQDRGVQKKNSSNQLLWLSGSTETTTNPASRTSSSRAPTATR